jgi:hypothetical protein
MDPLRLLGRFFRREKLPLTHEDIIRRASSLDDYFKRLQGKRVLVFDPLSGASTICSSMVKGGSSWSASRPREDHLLSPVTNAGRP